MTRGLTIIFLTLILSSCCSTDNKEFEFDNNEPRHLSCYKAGDTIYFENPKNDIDTITVLRIDSAKGEKCFGLIAPPPSGKSCWVTVKFLPIDKWHSVTINGNTNDTTSIDYESLIHIAKDPTENKTLFSFNFKDFHSYPNNDLGKLNTDTLMLNKKKITNYYLIKYGFPERIKDSTTIETLIWTDSDGLTAYKDKKGDWWTKQ